MLTWKKLSVLVLLDQSGALDTVDYEILIRRLENWVGLSGPVLKWLRTYPTGHEFVCHHWAPYLKDSQNDRGSPQGSVPGPFLFSLYKLPERHIRSRNTIGPSTATLMTPSSIFSVTPPGDIKVDKLAKCFADIKLSTVEPGQSCNTIFCRQRPTGNTSHSLQFSVTQRYRSGPKRSRYARLRSN